MAEERSAHTGGWAAQAAEKHTVLGYSRADRVVIFGGIPALGLLLGFVLPPLARLALELPILPMRSVVRLVGTAEQPSQVAVGAVLGLILGLGVAFVAVAESTRFTLTDTRVLLEHNDRTTTIERTGIGAVRLDGKRVVLFDHDAHPLGGGLPRVGRRAVARAFRAHGYPWREHGSTDEPG